MAHHLAHHLAHPARRDSASATIRLSSQRGCFGLAGPGFPLPWEAWPPVAWVGLRRLVGFGLVSCSDWSKGDTQTPRRIQDIQFILPCPECSPLYSIGKFRINTQIDNSTPRRFYEEALPSPLYRSVVQPNTPPESVSGSPIIKLERSSLSVKTDCSPVPRLSIPGTRCVANIRLPSLDEFDQGVEALARAHGGQAPSWTRATSPHPKAACQAAAPPVLPSIHAYSSSPVYSPQAYSPQDAYSPYSHSDSFMHGHSGYPSPPPDGENRHINQKYSTEEGDFIIYAWHDKKLKWQRIKQDFAAMFGRTPERTVQGLQAWYYRMNQRIPLWDKDGWLIFENDEDLEPKHISIKCRERDSQDRPMEPLGLAQRYPERAINYSWVDPEVKRKSRDWAAKRIVQYRERRERRKRKEQRRLKL
ncbi:hypothetical protein CCM_02615 [Cordyceps militaris CM01]|uniref:Uncharacterized protein n=1 Tax=Cordyceps militaris (strain CM01) TaxID=983644 RepID=G3JAT1_CORMM|nr:uncharacterized protein CCM_02615 [Cordyceps militaris CM01]EGX94344.1 hypothetical protein CCM_02615 [Cordyceps militaris CM01]